MPPSPPAGNNQTSADKRRRSPLYQRFLAGQRDIHRLQSELAASTRTLRVLRTAAAASDTKHEADRREIQALREAHQGAANTARNLQNRLTRHQEEGSRSRSRFNRTAGQERSNLIRVIDVLRRNSTLRVSRLANIEATRLGIRLPFCHVPTDQQVLVPEQEHPSRPSETIRVSGNSSLATSVNSGPDLRSLGTFENRLAALEQRAASGPVYAEVLQVGTPPNLSADLWSAGYLRSIPSHVAALAEGWHTRESSRWTAPVFFGAASLSVLLPALSENVSSFFSFCLGALVVSGTFAAVHLLSRTHHE